jgi:hypothetical protein
MNCKRVQELLPLYVGRDLEENCAETITAHVQSCAECAGKADEYRATRQLLQKFAPRFSDAVYAGVRQRVLREIGREATAPGLSRLLESLFRPRLRWAVATALLLAISVFGLYFITDRRNHPQQVAGSGRTVDRPTPSSIKESRRLSTASAVQNSGLVQEVAGNIHQSQRRKTIAGASDRARPATVNNADTRSITAEAGQEGNNLAEPDAIPVRDSATSGKTLRVEMQTEDPNIRIIWFTPQPNKQDAPSKFSKGT